MTPSMYLVAEITRHRNLDSIKAGSFSTTGKALKDGFIKRGFCERDFRRGTKFVMDLTPAWHAFTLRRKRLV